MEWLSGVTIDKVFCITFTCVYLYITEHDEPDKKPAGVAKQVHVCSLKARHSSSSIPSSLPLFLLLCSLTSSSPLARPQPWTPPFPPTCTHMLL